MAKEFIYFFKHKSVPGVKIGKTSGDSVIKAFESFKDFSPHGAEIIGFFESENTSTIEKDLHRKFANVKMNGDFFDITTETVSNVITQYDDSVMTAQKLFNELLAINKLGAEYILKTMKRIIKEDIGQPKYDLKDEIMLYIMHSEKFVYVKDVYDHFYKNGFKRLNQRRLAIALGRLGFTQISTRKLNGGVKKAYKCTLLDVFIP